MESSGGVALVSPLEVVALTDDTALLRTDEDCRIVECGDVGVVCAVLAVLAGDDAARARLPADLEVDELIPELRAIGAVRRGDAAHDDSAFAADDPTTNGRNPTESVDAPTSAVVRCLHPEGDVLVIGGGPLADRIARAVDDAGRPVRRVALGGAHREPLLAAYRDAAVFPPEPLWQTSDPAGDAPEDLRLGGCGLVVFAAEDAPFADLFAVVRRARAAGVPVLPVTCHGEVVEVGPLLLDATGRALLESRFTADIEALLATDPEIGSLGFLTTGSTRGCAPSAAGRAVAAAVRIATRAVDADCFSWSTARGGAGARHEFARPHALLSRSTGYDLSRLLAPELAADAAFAGAVSQALRDGALVSIPNAFRAEFAEAVHEALDRTDTWKLHEQLEPGFFFHHHNVYEQDELPAGLLVCKAVFDSAPTVRWIGELSGADCSEPCTATPSWYMPGDHSTPHTDWMEFATGGRRVAFVWHLTKSWDERWGGSLVWCRTGSVIPPSFNTLHLFRVSSASSHFVMQVAPNALGKRLTWNGWWMGSADDQLARRGLEPRPGMNGKFMVYPVDK